MRNQVNKLFLLLCMVLLSLGAYAQDKVTVTGTVVDNNGETVIGASILEAGTTNGTITDFDGNFRIQVKPTATLRISYVGYVSQSIRVNGQKNIQVTLVEDSKVVEEVVVVLLHCATLDLVGSFTRQRSCSGASGTSREIDKARSGDAADERF